MLLEHTENEKGADRNSHHPKTICIGNRGRKLEYHIGGRERKAYSHIGPKLSQNWTFGLSSYQARNLLI